MTSFENTINTETRIALARKTQQFPRISTHLMMTEWVQTCNKVLTHCIYHGNKGATSSLK
jgi:hypothetical protein